MSREIELARIGRKGRREKFFKEVVCYLVLLLLSLF